MMSLRMIAELSRQFSAYIAHDGKRVRDVSGYKSQNLTKLLFLSDKQSLTNIQFIDSVSDILKDPHSESAKIHLMVYFAPVDR
jgi:hypothetical protein